MASPSGTGHDTPRDPDVAFCKGGAATCGICVGSCGIEEYEASAAADPVVSPADTIRRLLYVVQDFLRVEYPRGTGHPADAEAARLMAALIRARTAFPALLAVGERDRARIEWLEGEERGWRTGLLAQTKRLGECEEARARDRQQIARLTEALRFYADPVSYENETPRHVRPVITDQGARARAVLADKEDAGDG